MRLPDSLLGTVGRAIVDDEHAVVRIVKSLQRAKALQGVAPAIPVKDNYVHERCLEGLPFDRRFSHDTHLE
jgi:hypothetical protein